jgi:hypothetical protein
MILSLRLNFHHDGVTYPFLFWVQAHPLPMNWSSKYFLIPICNVVMRPASPALALLPPSFYDPTTIHLPPKGT